MSTAVIWSKSKPDVDCRIPICWTFGRIPRHVIQQPLATLQGVILPSDILKIVFRHILFLLLFNAVWALTSGGFRIVSDALVLLYSGGQGSRSQEVVTFERLADLY